MKLRAAVRRLFRAFPASPRLRVSASFFLPVILVLLSAPAPAQSPAGATNALPVTFRAGDRVVLAGARAEALAQDGTFEALLQARLPELKLNLRTPAVPAETSTGLPAAGPLRAALEREQAEVVLLFLGADADAPAADALCGEILARPFSRRGTARLVLVAGPEAAPAPLREVATRHAVPLLDLGRAFRAATLRPDAEAGEPSAWALAHVLMQELRLALPEATLVLDADDLRFGSRVGRVRRSQRDGSTRLVDLMDVPLPSPPPPDGRHFPGVVPDHRRLVRITSLEPGRWTLSLDGEPLTTADARDWAAGLPVASPRREARAEQLRRAVVRKHELYRAGAPELGETEVQVWELAVLSPEIRYRISLAPAEPDKS